MTRELEEAVSEARTLPEDQQDRAAEILHAYVHAINDDGWDVDRG